MALEEIIGPKPGVPFAHAQDSNGGQVPVLSLPADPGTLELIKNAVPGVPFLYAYDPDQDVQMSVVMLHPDSPGTGGGGGGTDGKNGWSPVIGLVDNGPATVMRLVNWLGGSGTKPAVGAYIGATGLVTDINDAVNVRGGQGAKGDTGEAGPAGAKGDTGDTGPKGETGATGATGPKGDKGDTGEAGPKGDTGNQGLKGDPGDQGPAGLTGAKGDKGDAGEKGETGATGAKGDEGEQGPQGSQGATGWTPVLAVAPDGARSVLQVVDWAGTGSNKPTVGMYLGPDGFTSVIAEALTVRGPAGAKGDAGNDGAAGAPGEKGEQGDQGPAGAKGDKGDAGAKGDTGTNGTNGYSPLLTVVARGANDSVLQVFDWVGSVGPKPPTGQYLGLGGFVDDIADASSVRGVQGPAGAKGDKGDTGERGEQGIQGIQGPTGAKGDTGDVGPAGGAADIAAVTHASLQKITPVDADELALVDSANGFALRRLTWAYLKATLSSVFFPKAGGDLNGNLNFTVTGRRITADLSNTTLNLRLALQTTVANALSILGIMPSGTGTISGFRTHGGSDPANSSVGDLVILGGSEVRINSGAVGTGAYLPMTFYTSGVERMRITENGRLGFNIPAPSQVLDIAGSTQRYVMDLDNTSAIQSILNPAGASYSSFVQRASQFFWQIGTFQALWINTGGTVYWGSAGAGYGTGAGGTVTQATSKSTAVTINKACGVITMNNAALAANSQVLFKVNNTMCGPYDLVVLTLNNSGGGIDTSTYDIRPVVDTQNAGFYVCLRNISGGSLSQAVSFNFAITKGTVS